MDKGSVLITGGAGFIGSNLTISYLEKGYKVIVVDNFLTGRRENLASVVENTNLTVIEHDVIEPLPKDVRMAIGSPSFIFHLASPASVVDYQNNAEETALVNSVGTRAMLQLAKECGARFLFTSTSEVYGDPKEHPQKETYWGNVNPNGLRSCYDESKRFGEMMVKLYEREHGVDVRIVRIFNTYGVNMKKDDGRVVSNFITQSLAGEPITVYGDGLQTRSFCYVSDMVEGLTKMMHTDAAKGEVINLGNPEEYTMNELAKKVLAMTQSSSEIVYKPLPSDDPTVRKPDISKAKRILGWEPQVSVDAGLTKTIAYYSSLR